MAALIGSRSAARRGRRSVLLAGVAAAALGAGPAAAATYGLVIGVDDYVGSANDLSGAVNDARDIADTLQRTGASEVVLLTDAEASKQAIQETWFRLVQEAAPGDTIVFSFAGHGSQEPEPAGRRFEEDGLNENFLLGGYQPRGPASLERIVDDEMFEWLKAGDDRGLEVIFVADSCHSGTMYRDISSRTVRYRTGKFEDPSLSDDLLRLPDPQFAQLGEEDFSTVTFVGATQEGRLTPELTIDGKARGALSWAFSRALEGTADRDADGALTQQELLSYLVPAVETQAENQQIPSVLPLGAAEKPVIRITRALDTPTPAPVVEQAAILKVFVRGDATLPEVSGVARVTDEAAADLIWDPAAGVVEHRIGGKVAEAIGPNGIAAVLSKWSALAYLKDHAAADPISLTLPSGNQVYPRGEVVDLAMQGATLPYLTLFNLPPDGRVEFFIPQDSEEALTDWRGRVMTQRLRVQDPPFGAEHLVAIMTAEPATALHAALRTMGSANDAAGLAATLSAVLGDQHFQAGIVGIYTSSGSP